MTRSDGLLAFERLASVDTEGDSVLSEYEDGHWVVDSRLNTISDQQLGDRVVMAFDKRPQSYDELFRAAVARNPTGEAVICGNRRVTYRQLDMLVDQTARGLVGVGLVPGDRVAIMLDNRLEYLQSILAVIRAGGIAVPLGTRLGPLDIGHILGDSEPRLIVTAAEWASRFGANCSRDLYLVDGQGPNTLTFNSLAQEGGSLPRLDPHATMMIVYTSGTTGKPKGACLSHINFAHTCLHYTYALSIDRPLRSLLVVPGTHIAGFGPLMSTTIASAGTIVMMREFKAARVLETIQKEKISFAVLVPAMYQLCLMDESFDSHDLSTWVYGVYGGAIMPPAVIENFARKLPNLRMINAYGATETCAVCTIMPYQWTIRAPASVGLALHCDELRIVTETGEDALPGQSGELWIRGPNVSAGYWRNPEATQSSFVDGYWKSGDIASRDEDGLVFVHDRLKDMINRGGFKVFSAEVESALIAHKDVVDCAVVGVPDPVLGEKTFAFVQRRQAELTGDILRSYLKERIADYKIPDFWDVTDDTVPRNQNGKLQKADVRKLALEKLGSRVR